MAQQALQRLDPDVAAAVSQFGERRRGKGDLGERRQSLVDEPLQPAQRRTLVTFRVSPSEQFTERKRVGEDRTTLSVRGRAGPT